MVNMVNHQYNGKERKKDACYQQGVVQGMRNLCGVLSKRCLGNG